MNDYVIFSIRRGMEVYWTGEFRLNGRPFYSRKIKKALKFHSASGAYDWARPYRTLQPWRVGRRNEKTYRAIA